MPEIPHEYIVRNNLSDEDKKIFDEFDEVITKKGYRKQFYSKTYTYIDIGEYKYCICKDSEDDKVGILNREKKK